MYNYLLVFLGGGLGSICRFGIAQFLKPYAFIFPFATFLANALSCLVLGVLVGISLKAEVGNLHKLLLTTGFCGGFSTFSTFSNETLQLFQTGQTSHALASMVGNLFVCWLCIYLGMKLAS
ncbi:MAG: fluoride efflux transporter CrcB [Saprospiraceae bacterium]